MNEFLHSLTTGEATMVFGVVPLALCALIVAGTVLGLHRSPVAHADGDLTEPLLGHPADPERIEG
ncbi:MAG: hypothetical protein ABS81_18710 [Pseudonocardia sp. SCN 72-86]|nr:MAG: hypothetical protein ABS81_18710 [Pseudonocardia sp. SCN 72-86]